MPRLQFIPAQHDELQLDLDRQFFYGISAWHVHFCDWPALGNLRRSYRISRAGNTHCIIRLPQPLGPMQRICLQAGLGSDPVRERLSAERVRAKAPHPILFLEVEK